MNLLVVGLSHRTAPLELRELLAIPSRELPDTLGDLHTQFGIDEAVILSTCNRVEIYVITPDPSATSYGLIDFLSHRSHVAPEAFQSRMYCLTGPDAVRQLFGVTAGLDSMVLGESEITAQVKQAYRVAQTEETTGLVLHRLFQKALHTAKVIRSKTRLGFGQASIGSIVVALARKLFEGQLQNCEVLLWGAGKAAESTARYLIKNGVGQLWIVNRTPLKARDLATLCQSGWLSWEQALKHLAHVDIAIVCTQAPHYVIDQGDLDAVAAQRGSRPLCLVDLAVPRNVEPSLARHPGVRLYNIDDLQTITQAAQSQREQERERSDALIQEQVNHFSRWWMAVSHKKEDVPCRSVEAFSSV